MVGREEVFESTAHTHSSATRSRCCQKPRSSAERQHANGSQVWSYFYPGSAGRSSAAVP